MACIYTRNLTYSLSNLYFLKARFGSVRSQGSMNMMAFLESRKLDKETRDMLLKYDQDGDGRFSKDEVVEIICDLKSTKQHNDLLEASAKFY